VNSARVIVEGRELSLSNLEKVLYPETGFTKGEVIQYYSQIASVLLPHVRGRPMTLKRYPNGVNAPFFYEKQCPSHAPSWVHSVPVRSHSEGRTIDYCLVDDEATVVWLANLASLELHVSLSMAHDLAIPTSVVFDLDPGPPADIILCCRVALAIRGVLDHFGLASFAKSSGNKGMQLYVPLNRPATYEQTKAFSNAVARLMERQMPSEVVSRMAKELRRGKVFIDWSQNDEHKTTVAVYSLRARERATVSAPLAWDEIEAAATTGDAATIVVDAPRMLERVQKLGDLFAPMATLVQELPALS
jgi:bifunctional non-homologous end joining protein LigD